MRHRVDLYSRWAEEMRQKVLWRPGERVGVAVSGGPDSVLLLQFLKDLAREAGLTLAVVHFNHHLRGPESNADERFVRELAETMRFEFLLGQADVGQAARAGRRNLEATARDFRYRFFFSLLSQGRVDKVATAHTANDQAETVLLRLLRGTGTRGLGGIYPVLEGKVVRPFLTLTRAEVLNEIAKRKLAYREDASNLDLRRQRNKVRRELLPWLEKEFQSAIVPLLKNLADRSRDDETFLEHQARERAHPWRVREGNEEKIPVRALAEFPPALARRVVRQMLQATSGALRGLSHAHLDALLRFAAEAQSGRSLSLPAGIVARREFDWLIVGPPPVASLPHEFSCPVRVPGEISVPGLGVTLRFKIVRPADLPKAYNYSGPTGLDRNKLRGKLVLRNWRAGDTFCPLGSHKPRKLKELFRQQKIPQHQRSLWPVLESGGQIVWVRGFPPASAVAASAGSNEVLVIEEESTASR